MAQQLHSYKASCWTREETFAHNDIDFQTSQLTAEIKQFAELLKVKINQLKKYQIDNY